MLWDKQCTSVGARRRTPVLIGRRAPLDALEGALARLDGHSGELVLISGEAGIGKTRLVQDFTTAADVLAVTGGCVDGSTEGRAYAPWTELLWFLTREFGTEFFEAERSQLARLLPEFGEAADGGGDGKALLFEATVSALRRAAESRRLACVIEDVHWVDPASRDLLAYVARNLRRIPMLLVVTTRPSRKPEQREFVAQLSRFDADRIELGRLPEDDIADIASLLLGADVAAPEVRAIVARADGNPLFVEELAASLGEAVLPPTIRDLMLSRFNALGDDARKLVLTAATIGQRSPRALLVGAAGLEDVAREAAREAVDAGVLLADADGRGYSFAHAMLREAVLAELLPDDLVALHGAVAAALESLGSLDGDIDITSELARHYDAADRPQDALKWTVAAAELASSRFAFEAADALYERALHWWDRSHGHAGVTVSRVDLLFAAADAAGDAGQLDRAAARAAEAVALARGPERVAEAFTRSQPHLWAVGRFGEIQALADEALAQIDQLDDLQRYEFLITAGRAAIFDQRPEAALELTPTIDTIARVADADLLADAHLTYGLSYDALGDAERAAAELRAAADVARRNERWPMLARVLYSEASFLSSVPRLRESLARLDQLDEVVREHGIRRFVVASGSLRGDTLAWLGDLDNARAAVDRVAHLAMEGAELGAVHYTRGLIAWVAGQYDATTREVDNSDSTAGDSPQRLMMTASLRADALAWLGDHDAASTTIAEIVPIMQGRADPYWQGFVTMVGVRVEADRLARGQHDAALDLVVQARVDALLSGWQEITGDLAAMFPMTTAQSLGIEAELARITGKGAADAARRAAEAFAELEMPYYVAYFEWREAQAMIADRDRTSPVSALNRARTRAIEHGFAGLERAIDETARLEQLRLTPRGTTGEEMLTGREVEVLRLLADGLSNPDIAERLTIGRRTVRTHVSNILQKLGVTTRAEAVSVAHRQRIL
jgi:DNA-binding CsgD family transcriptional regulator/tetratricopeptide (TPR) repeat protein